MSSVTSSREHSLLLYVKYNRQVRLDRIAGTFELDLVHKLIREGKLKKHVSHNVEYVTYCQAKNE